MNPLRKALLFASCVVYLASAHVLQAQDMQPQEIPPPYTPSGTENQGFYSQNPDCYDVAQLARMAQSESSKALAQIWPKAGGGYLAQSVLAGRTFELHQDKMFAIRILDLIPRNEEQHQQWMSMRGTLCNGESTGQRNVLTTFHNRLSGNLADAALLVPTMMQNYVAYALVATTDPSDDYAIHMQRVCRTQHETFLGAVRQLPEDKRNDFHGRVFDQDTCQALAVPAGRTAEAPVSDFGTYGTQPLADVTLPPMPNAPRGHTVVVRHTAVVRRTVHTYRSCPVNSEAAKQKRCIPRKATTATTTTQAVK